MNNWKNWYNAFLDSKRNSEFQAFAAGLNGEKYEPPVKLPKFDSTSSWSELVTVVNQKHSDLESLDFFYKDGLIQSENPLILVCFEKARKQNSSYGINSVLNYLIYNFLKTKQIKNLIELIKQIRQIPDEVFLECNNCGENNEPGWSVCTNCQIDIESSFDEL